jgi:hypothetical protein
LAEEVVRLLVAVTREYSSIRLVRNGLSKLTVFNYVQLMAVSRLLISMIKTLTVIVICIDLRAKGIAIFLRT